MALVIQSYFNFLMIRETGTVNIVILFTMRELRLKETTERLYRTTQQLKQLLSSGFGAQ